MPSANKTIVITESESVEGNVRSKEQLSLIPPQYLSDDPARPLLRVGRNGTEYKYALRPFVYSVFFILIVECLERFAYYGISNTETAYLTGVYGSWNAKSSDVEAASMVGTTIVVSYTSPILGGILADGWLGDYWEVALGVAFLYIPGLLLIALTTIPHLLGETFNVTASSVGLAVLWPLGTGAIKTTVNVFGAKQFHPLLQRDMIATYYLWYYMVITIGGLLGSIVIPLMANINITIAYFIPFGVLALGFLIFVSGSKRYVREKPDGTVLRKTLKLLTRSAIKCQSLEAFKKSQGGDTHDGFVDGVKQLIAVILVTLLVVPANLVYGQQITVFVLMGEVMNSAGGFLDASMMNIFDAIAVLITGYFVGKFLFPYLERRDIRFPLTYKFALGTAMTGLSIAWTIVVEHELRARAAESGEKLSVLWVLPSYALMGSAEIFVIASSYEAVFVIAPKEQKALASAINIFSVGGLPNLIAIGLYQACQSWFPPGHDAKSLTEYVDGKMYNYLWLLLGISVFGTFLNLLPCVKNWVEKAERDAIDNNLRFSRQRYENFDSCHDGGEDVEKDECTSASCDSLHNST